MRDEYLARIGEGRSSESFRESFQSFSGQVLINMVDLRLPGVGGLDVVVQRYYQSGPMNRTEGSPPASDFIYHASAVDVGDGLGGGGWQMHMGKVRNPWGTGSPTGFLNQANNPVVIMPDGSSHPLYLAVGSSPDDPYRVMVTAERWRYQLVGPHRWELTLNDGTVYVFDLGTSCVRDPLDRPCYGGPCVPDTCSPVCACSEGFPSRSPTYRDMLGVQYAQTVEIRDVHGNRIEIDYTDEGNVDNIYDTYGRHVDFTYHPAQGDGTTWLLRPRLDRVYVRASANGAALQTWTYAYAPYYDAQYEIISGPGTIATLTRRVHNLTGVTPPAGNAWAFTYDTSPNLADGRNQLRTVTTPSGGTITYDWGPLNFDVGHEAGLVQQSVLSTKSIAGRGVTAGTWSYQYASAGSSGHKVTVLGPEGRQEIFEHHGWTPYSAPAGASMNDPNLWRVGLLWRHTISLGGQQVVENTTWTTGETLSNDYRFTTPWNGFIAVTRGRFVQGVPFVKPAQTVRTVTRGGVTWTTTATNFDAYGNAQTVTEDGQADRTTTLEYWYNPALHILDGRLHYRSRVPGEREQIWYTPEGQPARRILNAAARHPSEPSSTDGVDFDYTYGPSGFLGSETRRNHDSQSRSSDYFATYSYTWGRRSRTEIEMGSAPNIVMQDTITPLGFVSSREDGHGAASAVEYTRDALGRVTAITPPVGDPTTFTYAADGSKVTVARGSHSVEYTFDGFDRLTERRDVATGDRTTTTYDALRRITAQAAFPGGRTGDVTTFDDFERPALTTHPDATRISYSYADASSESTVTVLDERAKSLVHRYAAFGDPSDRRLKSVTDALDGVWSYTYHAQNGLLTSVDGPGVGADRSFTYGAGHFVQSETSPQGGTVTYVNSPAGAVLERRRGSDTIVQRYDPAGRLTRVDPPGTAHDVDYTYDAAGHRTGVTNAAAQIVFAYDDAGRMTSKSSLIAGRSYLQSFRYDTLDRLIETTYPSGRKVGYTYDTKSRLTAIQDATTSGAPSFISNVTYEPWGAPSRVTYQGGQASEFGYDSRFRVTSLAVTKGTQTHVDVDWGYDAAGNLVGWVDQRDGSRSRTFGYDAINRLTLAEAPQLWGRLAYGYNAAGDRTSSTLDGNTTTYGYDASTGRLATVSGTHGGSYGWDTFGRLINSPVYVPPPPPLAVSGPVPAQVRVDSGQSLSFSVQAQGGQGAYTYRWYRSTSGPTSSFTPIADGDVNYTGQAGPTLMIASAGQLHEGWYRCDVTDQTPRTVTSASAALDVFVAGVDPVASTPEPPSLTVETAGRAQFSVTVTPAGTYSYRWQVLSGGWSDLVDGGGVSGSGTPTLVIDPARTTHSGSYRLRVARGTPFPEYSPAATLVVTPPPDEVPMGEAGTITLTHEPLTVNFARTYQRPVVIAQPPSYEGGDPVIVRILSVSPTSFTLRLVEPPNLSGTHTPETVFWMVAEEGSWLLRDGTRLDVGSTSVSKAVGRAFREGGDYVAYQEPFPGSIIVPLTQIQQSSEVDYLKSLVWEAAGEAYQRGFYVALESYESRSQHPAPVKVGWVALQQQVRGEWGGTNFSALVHPPVGPGALDTESWHCAQIPYPSWAAGQSFTANPATEEEAALRLRRGFTGCGLEFRLEEDTTWDSETTHAPRGLYFLVLQGSLLQASPRPLRVSGPVPASQSVPEGGTAVFTLSAVAGVRPYRYQWQFSPTGQLDDWSALIDPDHPQGAPQYTLAGATPGDQGFYRCKVFDALGAVATSGAVELLVGDQGGAFTVEVTPTHQSASLGGSAGFAAQVTNPPATPVYAWEFLPLGGTQFRDLTPADAGYAGIASPTLTIGPAAYAHHGVYRVRVSAGGQQARSDGASFVVAGNPAATEVMGEVGQATATGNTTRVSFGRTFVRPVVIAQPPSAGNADPVVVRLTNVNSSGFDLRLVEPPNLDGAHPAESVHWLALETGSWVLADGRGLEVGMASIDKEAYAGRAFFDHAQPVSLRDPLPAGAVLLTQEQTRGAGGGVPEFLSTLALPQSANSFAVAMQSYEALEVAAARSASVGWIALGGGSGSWNGHVFHAGAVPGNAPDAVTSAWSTRSFASVGASPHFFAQLWPRDLATTEEATLRHRSLTATSVQVKVDEDTTWDAETTHGAEGLFYLAMGGNGFLSAASHHLWIDGPDAPKEASAGQAVLVSIWSGGGDQAHTYRWQWRPSAGAAWTDLSDGNSAYSGQDTRALTIPAFAMALAGEYRCRVTAGPVSDVSRGAAIAVAPGGGSAPFLGQPHRVSAAAPALIQAEHYDLGGEGAAYHDTTPGNVFGAFRAPESVDVGDIPAEAGGGRFVGSVQAGEWLNYTLTVPNAGLYRVTLRVASAHTLPAPDQRYGARLRFELDGAPFMDMAYVPHTGASPLGWQTYSLVTLQFALPATTRGVLRVVVDSGFCNIDWIRVADASSHVFHDSFANLAPARDPGDLLNATPTEVGALNWIGGNAVRLGTNQVTHDGTGGNGIAGLPIAYTGAPEAGHYLLGIAADVDPTGTQWVGLGLSQMATGDLPFVGQVWLRLYPSGVLEAWANGVGTRLANLAGNAYGFRAGQTNRLELEYDENGGHWVSARANGVPVVTRFNLDSIPFVPAPRAGDTRLFAGFQMKEPASAGGAKIDNFSLLVETGGAPLEPRTGSFVCFNWSCDVRTCEFFAVGSQGCSVGRIDSFQWNFGDGATSALPNPVHTYATAGTRTVTLTGWDDLGATSTSTRSVTASGTLVACFNWDCDGLTCQFHATDSRGCSAGGVVATAWSFGDGASSSASNPSHVFPAAGTYDVTLTVRNAQGQVGLVTNPVTVAAASALAPCFTWQCNALTCGFDASCTGGPMASCAWQFGDGAGSLLGPTVDHAYVAGGTYQVSLAVSSPAGTQAAITRSVQLAEPITNYAPNPGFEAGSGTSATSWMAVRSSLHPATSMWRGGSADATPRSGAYGFAVGNLMRGALQSDWIPGVGGASYDVYAWVRGELAPAASEGFAGIRVYFQDAAGASLGFTRVWEQYSLPVTTTWQRQGGRVTLPAGAARLQVWLWSRSTSGWVAFDDVEVLEVGGNGKNWAPNPGFEEGTGSVAAGWAVSLASNYPGTSVWRGGSADATPRSGSYAGAISNLMRGALQSKWVGVTAGADYDVYAWMRGELAPAASEGFAGIRVYFQDAAGASLGFIRVFEPYSLPFSTTWQRLGGRFTVPAGGTKAQVWLWSRTTSGWVAFDDVELLPAGGGTNLLPNPGFELGLDTLATDWTAVPSATYPGTSMLRASWGEASPRSGTYAYAISNLARGDLRSDWIPVMPGTTYDVYAWVRGELDPLATAGFAGIRVSFQNASGATVGSLPLWEDYTLPLSSAWQRQGGRFTTPPDAVRLQIWLWSWGASGWVTFDDVELSEP